MTVRFTSKLYYVLAYGSWDESTKIFLFPDDYLEIIEPVDTGVKIIEKSLSGYIRRDDFNYGKEFYIDEKFNKLITKIGLKNYHEIKDDNNLWKSSKLSPFFIVNNYEIPDSYKRTVLNESYKLNLIQGFLIAINNYLNYKYRDSSYNESFWIEKLNHKSFSSLENLKKLELKNYKELLIEFISETLNIEKPNEKISKENCIQLFLLIDSIFLNDITRIYNSKDFYNKYFIIEYNNEYYSLIKDWGS